MLRPNTFALTALLAALTAVGPLTTDMYLPSLPQIARVLDASTAQAQFTISSYLIGFAIGQIFYGPFSDRHGRKPVVLAAVAIYCVATLGCALSTSIEMLIVARLFQAIGGSGGIVLARAIVRDLYSGVRAGRELSVMASVMALAPVIAPVIGGALQTAFGWQASFILLAASGVMGIALIYWLLPETLEKRAEYPVSPATMLNSYRIVARNRCYLAYLALVALTYAGLFAWISGASFVLQDLYGLSPFSFGVAFALGSIGYMVGSALAARLVGKFGLDVTAGIGAVGNAAGGLGMIAAVGFGATSAAWIVIPMAVYLAGMGMVLSQGIAGAMSPFPERAGAASSLLGFVQQTLAAACGAAVGILLGQSAWPLAGAVAAMGCLTLLLWVLTRGVRAQGAAHS
ncbi:MAG TPA: multidrug effflux MFS transporter [Pseudolabrys sp.]|nr:multidrug effflux MFS transporter [Pseudolabrys sp.]